MKFIGWKDVAMADMLQSIKRLNKELDSRVQFESVLLSVIDEYTEKIKDDEKLYNELNNEYGKLEEKCNTLEQNFIDLKKLAEQWIPKGYILVKNAKGEIELYPD